MVVKVIVDGQKLKIETNLKIYISGTHSFVKFKFYFLDKDWADKKVFAQFLQEDVVAYQVYLDADNSVYLPAEIQPGKWCLTIQGDNETSRAITKHIELIIEDNCIVFEGGEESPITQSLYNQLLGILGTGTLDTEDKTYSGAINELYAKIKLLESQEIFLWKESEINI